MRRRRQQNEAAQGPSDNRQFCIAASNLPNGIPFAFSVRFGTAQTKASKCTSGLNVTESRMRSSSWQRMVGRLVRRVSFAESPNWKQRHFCRLSIRRLENRRVLSGTPLGTAVTVSDAKGAL